MKRAAAPRRDPLPSRALSTAPMREVHPQDVEAFFARREKQLHTKLRYLRNQITRVCLQLTGVILARRAFRRAISKRSHLP